ncbi:sensor histidine kinase [Nocardiopsis sp. JB363]|uniref:sensor histidine kinase n=1 Tax=Nocardiopsis sp. JB363 TaxID=1434837 RepID=UPI00097B7C56|nr:histidine kinase [Nocardiopsis sp. JB363]SIO84481.1 sensor histidine kinase [Nocardiopsis sp. JB363]
MPRSEERHLPVQLGGALLGLLSLPGWVLTAPDRPVALVLLVGVLYTAGCVAAIPLAGDRWPVLRLPVCVGLLAAGWAILAWIGPQNPWVLLYALVVIAALLPLFWILTLTGATMLGLLVWSVATGEVLTRVPDLLMIASVTAVVGLLVSLMEANVELRRARGQVAELATARERERVARDLHDILGHSLTTVAVKAGLARRVLDKGGDPDSASEQIGEVEELSRRALDDVRATVDGYREVRLSVELANAAEALRSAGVDADLPRAIDDLDPALRSPFGYVLREAVTNVVRHAHADRVRVRLGADHIEITDDGNGHPEGRFGNGLSGLTERMRAVDGRLRTGTGLLGGDRAGFTVYAYGDGHAGESR